MPNLAFVTYESPFAPAGGIAAVMGQRPRIAAEISGQRTVVITGWHNRAWRRSPTDQPILPNAHKIGSLGIIFHDHRVNVNVMLDPTPPGFYFIAPDTPAEWNEEPLFAGNPHPYRTNNHATLVRDSLFFGAAVIRALPVVAPGDWVLFLQDWETATAALASASIDVGIDVRNVLTLHNTYDSGGIAPDELTAAGLNPAAVPGANGLGDSSILERALPIVEHRVFSVSVQFGRDMLEDVLLSRVMGPQLPGPLGDRIQGVDNGPFVPTVQIELRTARRRVTAAQNDTDRRAAQNDVDILVAKSDALHHAKIGNHENFFKWKKARREHFRNVVASYKFDEPAFPPDDASEQVQRNWKPFWGNRSRFLDRSNTETPWFVSGGRDDSRQRGHDVAAAAAEQFLASGRDAIFVFAVIPGDEDLRGLQFLYERACRSDGRIIALPFIFREGYLAALEGAAFGVFPSLYEPFGGASDIYAQATLAIARATGGLVQQIVPLRAARCYSEAVNRQASFWHTFSARPTGLLYREAELDEGMTVASWQGINEAGYLADRLDRVQQRQQFPAFQGMQRELHNAIADAVRILETPALYTEMVLGGMAHIEKTFSWHWAAGEYLRAVNL